MRMYVCIQLCIHAHILQSQRLRIVLCIRYLVGQKNGPFLNVDNFAMVSGRKACYTATETITL